MTPEPGKPLTSEQENFIVECAVCKQRLQNWVGSTPCCGSIAYVVDEQGNTTKSFMLYGKIDPNEKGN